MTKYKNVTEKIQKSLDKFIEKDIPATKFFKPDGHPNKEWVVFYGTTWDAAWDVVRSAARDAAWDVVRSAAKGAARDAAWYAAKDAAWDAAWYAAKDAARDAAKDAARDAARDAALYADFIVVSDLDFKDKKKHEAHVKARWEVFQKGYALICDINGVFYVYCKGKPPK
jgi:hypothetical protein